MTFPLVGLKIYVDVGVEGESYRWRHVDDIKYK